MEFSNLFSDHLLRFEGSRVSTLIEIEIDRGHYTFRGEQYVGCRPVEFQKLVSNDAIVEMKISHGLWLCSSSSLHQIDGKVFV